MKDSIINSNYRSCLELAPSTSLSHGSRMCGMAIFEVCHSLNASKSHQEPTYAFLNSSLVMVDEEDFDLLAEDIAAENRSECVLGLSIEDGTSSI